MAKVAQVVEGDERQHREPKNIPTASRYSSGPPRQKRRQRGPRQGKRERARFEEALQATAPAHVFSRGPPKASLAHAEA